MPAAGDSPVDAAGALPLAAWLAATEAELRERLRVLDPGAGAAGPAAPAGAGAAAAAPPAPEPLLAWAGVRMDEVERIDAFLGALLTRVRAGVAGVPGDAAEAALANPAVLVASLAGRATRVAATADLWADWPAGLGLDPADPAVAGLVDAVAAALPGLLAGLGLADVAELDGARAARGGREDSARLAMLHAGVQRSVMPLIIERIEAAAGLAEADPAGPRSPADIVAALHGVRDRVGDLVAGFAADADGEAPRPLRVLASSAPARAAELVSATLGFLLATAADPLNWESREDLDAAAVGLPEPLAESAREELRARPAGTAHRRQAVGISATTGRPQLFFDEFTATVGVQLPTPANPGRRSWRVTCGGQVAVAEAVALAEGAARPVVALDEPVREVLVELGEDRAWRLPAVDTEDPVLIFGADGQAVTGKVSLHSESVHVIYPDDATLVDPVTGEPVPLLTDPRPARWPLWQVAVADLREVTAVQVRRPGVTGAVRSASPRRRPRLTTPHARLDGAVTAHGTPVHAGGPVAVFPPTLSGRDESWRVQLAEFGGYGVFAEELTMEYQLEVPAAGGEVEILTDDDYPWVGEFVVRLTNPRGMGFQAHFAVAEGAQLDIAPRGGGDGFRIPADGGLSPAEVRLSPGDKPLAAEPAVLRLGAAETSGEITVATAEGAELALRVTPGVLSFRVPLLDEAAAVRTRTLRTRPGRVDAAGEFEVHAPGELRHAHLSVRGPEGEVCRVPMTRRGDEAVGRLGGWAEKVAGLAEVTVSLEWTRSAGRRRLSVPLVEAAAADPVAEAGLAGGVLTVRRAGTAADAALSVHAWSAARPWLAPVAVALPEDGRVALPEPMRGDSPVVAQVVWGAPEERAPRWPSPEARPLIDAEAADGADAAAAGAAGPADQADLVRLWSLLAAWRTGRAGALATAPGAPGADRVRGLLAADARRGLAALNAASIRLADQPGLLISSGVVLGDFTRRADSPGRRRVPWLGALAALADVTAAEAGGDADAAAAQRAFLRATAGPAALEALATGQDPTVEAAKIDATSVQIAALPPAQAEAILAQVFDRHRMVPGPLTDDDARFTAIHEVVTRRAEIVDSGLMVELAKSSRALFQQMSKVSPRLRKAVNVRFHKLDGIDAGDPGLHWTLVPGTSLLIAVAARALARDNARRAAAGLDRLDESPVRELLPQWARLADLVPTLVMGDILIADAMAAHAVAAHAAG